MNHLLAAILDDDRNAIQAMLKADNGLATRLIDEPVLYEEKIFHWIYAGDTALHLAAAGYRVEIVRLLLKAGANPNAAANHRRGTPLHYAVEGLVGSPVWNAGSQVKTIECLLENGADIHFQDKNGATALHRAVRTRCAAAVKCLLQAGSDPGAKNKSGSTPFHLAVQNTGRGGSGSEAAIDGQREIIREFVRMGVSPDLKDGNGKSVRDCVKSAWIREALDGSALR